MRTHSADRAHLLLQRHRRRRDTGRRERLASGAAAPQPIALDRLFQSIPNHSRFLELFYYRIGYPRLVRDRLEELTPLHMDVARSRQAVILTLVFFVLTPV